MTDQPPKPACDICRLLAQPNRADEVIFATMWWRVTLAPEQSYLGRVYVTARAHAGNISQLSPAAWIDLQAVIGRYEQIVRRAFGATHVNWGCLLNNAYAEPEPHPHVHWHGRPRYREAPRLNGRAWPDPNYPAHYTLERPRLVGAKNLTAIAGQLRAAL
jgi:diadenosine tetraphosphate (Ap4A) HIT family hydrolase